MSGRHDRYRQQEDAARYQLRKGMAKVALLHKDVAKQTDAKGKPMYYAVRMAEGVGRKELERYLKGRSTRTVVNLS